MSVQIPNVLCIKNVEFADIDVESNSATIMTNPLPNMRANRLYYLLVGQNERLYHIKSVTIGNKTLSLELGNSFQVKRCPKFTKDIAYVKLSDFGYQQLEPGCLVEIKN